MLRLPGRTVFQPERQVEMMTELEELAVEAAARGARVEWHWWLDGDWVATEPSAELPPLYFDGL